MKVRSLLPTIPTIYTFSTAIKSSSDCRSVDTSCSAGRGPSRGGKVNSARNVKFFPETSLQSRPPRRSWFAVLRAFIGVPRETINYTLGWCMR